MLASACTTTNSQDVTTHGIYAELGARADGDGLTDTYATLFFGNPLQLDFVRLTGNGTVVTQPTVSLHEGQVVKSLESPSTH